MTVVIWPLENDILHLCIMMRSMHTNAYPLAFKIGSRNIEASRRDTKYPLHGSRYAAGQEIIIKFLSVQVLLRRKNILKQYVLKLYHTRDVFNNVCCILKTGLRGVLSYSCEEERTDDNNKGLHLRKRIVPGCNEENLKAQFRLKRSLNMNLD